MEKSFKLFTGNNLNGLTEESEVHLVFSRWGWKICSRERVTMHFPKIHTYLSNRR